MARLLVTDPERRPSAREILESLTVQNESISVSVTPENNGLSNLDITQTDEAPQGPAESLESIPKKHPHPIESNIRHGAKNLERSIRHKLKKKKRKDRD